MIDEDPNGYQPSHPWYYVLGGNIMKPSAIRDTVLKSGYRGYLEADIGKAANRPEPKRSSVLRELMERSRHDFFSDLSRYRQCVTELRNYRIEQVQPESECHEIHTSISLKHNHLYNDFAHLIELEKLLNEQPDLFSLMSPKSSLGGARGR